MPHFKTIDDIDVSGKIVLVRVDYNVPVRNGRVTDATRIERSLTTIKDLQERGARVVCISHFGRPKGQRVEDMSLRPIADAMATAVSQTVSFAEE